MSRFHVYAAIAVFLALPAAAQTPASCNLTVTVSCSTPAGSSSACQSTTLNSGATACTGQFVSGFWILGPSAGTVTNFHNSLGLSQCFDSSIYPIASEGFSLCIGDASLAPGGSFTASADISGQGQVYGVSMVDGAMFYAIANVSGPTCTPTVSSPPVTQSGLEYEVSWSAVSDPTAQYIVDESTAPDFSANLVETQVNGRSKTFHHVVTDNTVYFYRVKATNCAAGTPDFSQPTRTVVQAPPPATSKNPQATVPFGTTQPVSIKVFIPGSGAPPNASADPTFTAATDKPYLTVTPSSGTIPPAGTTVTVTASPGSLPAGGSTGTLKVTTNGTTTTNTPVSINLVTPVQPGGIDTPPPNALVIPVVTHINAGAGPFLSDVRLTNASGQSMNYLVTMAPAGTDATKNSQSTTITVGPQQTAALNDIVKNFFGIGATGSPDDKGFGALQVRPLDSASLLTFAASRTYTTQSIGTFGQFIAAIPFAKFATLALPPIGVPGSGGHTATKLSLQQIAQSSRWRTNIGIAEASGQPASGILHFFDDAGNLVHDEPFSLKGGEVQQNGLGLWGVPSLADGRVEVEITSPVGAVTAYASVLDQGTSDPFEVTPVDVSVVSSTRYVLPGISGFDASNFHSDVRIFNAGATDVTATLTLSPIAGLPTAAAQTITIPHGQIAKLDDIIPNFFHASETGGSVIITTPSPSSLVATANTFSKTATGTYGQFIPGVTPDQGIALGDRPLQVMQLEQSDQFRSNIGLAELTGNPATVEVSLYQPDAKETPFIDVDLGPNEFKQLNSIVSQFFHETGQTYNARVTVQVKSGTGRVTAYGSIIDNQSKDPTFAPAQ